LHRHFHSDGRTKAQRSAAGEQRRNADHADLPDLRGPTHWLGWKWAVHHGQSGLRPILRNPGGKKLLCCAQLGRGHSCDFPDFPSPNFALKFRSANRDGRGGTPVECQFRELTQALRGIAQHPDFFAIHVLIWR
jgi:hypothetical protein